MTLLRILLLCGSLCCSTLAQAVPTDDVMALLQHQQQTWNQGDINSYMQGYWHNDQLRFVSGGRFVYGWDNMLKAYQQNYPDQKTMGQLQLKVSDIRMLSNYAALVVGEWQLQQPRGVSSGVFTLLVEKHDDQWVIVHDHTS
ncbi:YybH family protein [Shewanella dokdonensis]|uniref:DUF4440 domain-containing protein n=1 Tax=Shewanella dokdonensis TaxID=712036 RepID=A0ABX8DIS8_9GAMM|nr:nuclear transport factor 2 family protein [Shewanella dokdonensis]MCL1075624.1 nuclear transport factor 2 family protein [Shewanella dokdonensis]QVK24625.1 DUF4440 domain-containing protein [Shewanella dokdonensis]